MKSKQLLVMMALVLISIMSCNVVDGGGPQGVPTDDPSEDPADNPAGDPTDTPGVNSQAEAEITGTARFYPWDTHDLYSTSHLSGYVDMIIGTESFSLPASSFSFFNHYYLEAPFTVSVEADGPVPMFLFSSLYYSDPPIFEGPVAYAGVALVDAIPGQTSDMYEGIPELAASEYQDFYVPLDVDTGYSPVGLPEIDSISIDSDTTTAPFVTVTGLISNTDLSVAALKINKTYLLVQLESAGSGRRSFTKTVDIQPGKNTIQLLAVSTVGHVISSSQDVTFTAQSTDTSQPDIYTSLSWDWPSSNMDLFVWYFEETSPGPSSQAQWLAEAKHGDVPGAPNSLDSSSFFGGGNIGHTNGVPVFFTYDGAPAQFTFEVDDSLGEYSLSMGNMGDVVFDLSGRIGRSGGFWDGAQLGSFDLGIPETATGFFDSGGFSFATMTNVSGTLEILKADNGLVTGSISLEGPAENGIAETDFLLSFSDALYQEQTSGAASYSNPNMNLDIKESRGYGPEHFTLYDAPNGYYVFAVASISMDEPEHSPNSFLHSRVFIGATIDETQYRFSPHWFENQHADPLTQQNAPTSYWFRVFDLRVSNGTPTVLTPDSSVDLAGYPDLTGLR